MPEAAAVDWDMVRHDYENRIGTLDDICIKFGVSRSALSWRARHHHWRMRNTRSSASSGAIAARMFRLLERQLFELESRTEPMGEKEAAALSKLGSTLERLIEVDQKAKGSAQKLKPRQSKEMQDLRNKLIERIEQLQRG